VQRAQAVVNSYAKTPAFPYSSPKYVFDAKKARGKTVFTVPVNSSIPFVEDMDQSMQQAAKLLGMTFVDYPNSGAQSDIVRGIESAISRKPAVLVLLAVNPKTVAPQIAQAVQAGIKVVIGHELPAELPPTPNTVGQTVAPFYQAAQFEADYPIAQSCGHVDALAISSLEQLAAAGMLSTMKQEFARNCPGCTFKSVNVPGVSWSTEIQPDVQTGLVNDPNVNYLIPFYDSESQFAAPGVLAAGRSATAHIVTFNGTPFVLKMIEQHNVVSADIGEDTQWLGWAIMDQVARAAAGVPLIPNEHTGLRYFNSGNVSQTGTPPVAGAGYGSAYISGYKKLWGLAK
jgi:ribose transport system substrate-binding protein